MDFRRCVVIVAIYKKTIQILNNIIMKRPKASSSLRVWEKYREYKKDEQRKRAIIKQIGKMK